LSKKLFVAGLICLLAFGAFLGSGLCTAGEGGIEQQFHDSKNSHFFCLDSFVLGYGM